MPAQLTRPISLPMDTAWATTAWPSASLLTSHFTNTPPMPRATASPLSACMSAITTLPPLAANMRAVPSPRPDAPPVTMKTLPAMSMLLLLSGGAASAFDVDVNVNYDPQARCDTAMTVTSLSCDGATLGFCVRGPDHVCILR